MKKMTMLIIAAAVVMMSEIMLPDNDAEAQYPIYSASCAQPTQQNGGYASSYGYRGYAANCAGVNGSSGFGGYAAPVYYSQPVRYYQPRVTYAFRTAHRQTYRRTYFAPRFSSYVSFGAFAGGNCPPGM